VFFSFNLSGIKSAIKEAVNQAMVSETDRHTSVLSLQQKVEALVHEKIMIQDQIAASERNSADRAAIVIREAEDKGSLELRKVKDTIEDMVKQHERELFEFEFLAKKNEERLQIDIDRKELELEKKFQVEKQELQQKFYNDTLKILEENKGDMQKIHSAILDRLPKIDAFIKHSNQAEQTNIVA